MCVHVCSLNASAKTRLLIPRLFDTFRTGAEFQRHLCMCAWLQQRKLVHDCIVGLSASSRWPSTSGLRGRPRYGRFADRVCVSWRPPRGGPSRATSSSTLAALLAAPLALEWLHWADLSSVWLHWADLYTSCGAFYNLFPCAYTLHTSVRTWHVDLHDCSPAHVCGTPCRGSPQPYTGVSNPVHVSRVREIPRMAMLASLSPSPPGG